MSNKVINGIVFVVATIGCYALGFNMSNYAAGTRHKHEVVVALQGMTLEDVAKMRDECEKALPRNQHCSMTFTPSEVINGRMVEEGAGSGPN